MNTPISVTILTKNSEKYLKEVLSALKIFPEVLVYDTGSKDRTCDIASCFPNVRIVKHPFIGFGPTHNSASHLATHDWILSIDSDEVVTPELINEMIHLLCQMGSVYSIPRHNEYRGRWIKWCGWHPDRQVRLYNRKETAFTPALVHEAIITTNMKVVKLLAPLRHYSYQNISEFLIKMESYSSLFAEQNKGKKTSSLCRAILHGVFSFFKSYVIKQGFLGGREGFEISVYNANTAFYKYLKLAEANEKVKESDKKSSS